MTQVKRVSLAEMIGETGMPALGYSRPQADEILLVDGMPKAKENEVLAHEYEHMARGEEGPFLGAIGGALGIGSALLGSKASKKAGQQSADASRYGADLQNQQFNLSMLANLLMNAPAINTGNAARSQLAGMLGIETPAINYQGIEQYLRRPQ